MWRRQKTAEAMGTDNIRGHLARGETDIHWQVDLTELLGSCGALVRKRLLATAGLAYDLHHDFMQIGAGGV
jgi:hypothetical protein